MNFFAALGLLYLDEEATFWYMVAIIEKILPDGYFSTGLLEHRLIRQANCLYKHGGMTVVSNVLLRSIWDCFLDLAHVFQDFKYLDILSWSCKALNF